MKSHSRCVTGITDMLEKEQLVAREPDPADRRAYRVRLTREGRRQFRRMAAEHERWVIGLMAGLSRRQRDQLVELLGALKSELSREITATSGPDGNGAVG